MRKQKLRNKKIKVRVILIFSLTILLVNSGFYLAFIQNWDTAYHRLNNRVEENFAEPRGQPNQLEPYLRWMEIKAKDRNEVKSLLDEALRQSQQNPEDEVLKMWVKKFTDLLKRAQASGESTVNGAVLKFMRIEDPKFSEQKNWQVVIWRLQNYGRPIYLKAQETGFLTPNVRASARCMLNFSLRDVECDPEGFGVYRGREGVFGQLDEKGNIVVPDRDFNVDCEPRSSFVYTSKGEPHVPTDTGLDWINQVREEARWWQFGEVVNEATDLMEEYYEDTMCKVPPNACREGHRYYRELAEKYDLVRGRKYNKGFYGLIYGHVDIVSPSGRKPAREALITVVSLLDGETWTAETDDRGNYKINEALLHKECKPFKITASHEMGETTKFFEGPLEKPDPSYRLEKNLEINVAEYNLIAEYYSIFQESLVDEESGGYSKKDGFFFSIITAIYKLEGISKTENEIYEKYNLMSYKLEFFLGHRHYELHFEDMDGHGQDIPTSWQIKDCGTHLGISYDLSSGNVRTIDLPIIEISFNSAGQVEITWIEKTIPPSKRKVVSEWDNFFPGEPKGFYAVSNSYLNERVSGNIKGGLISGQGFSDFGIYKFNLQYNLKKVVKKPK